MRSFFFYSARASKYVVYTNSRGCPTNLGLRNFTAPPLSHPRLTDGAGMDLKIVYRVHQRVPRVRFRSGCPAAQSSPSKVARNTKSTSPAETDASPFPRPSAPSSTSRTRRTYTARIIMTRGYRRCCAVAELPLSSFFIVRTFLRLYVNEMIRVLCEYFAHAHAVTSFDRPVRCNMYDVQNEPVAVGLHVRFDSEACWTEKPIGVTHNFFIQYFDRVVSTCV